MPDNDTIVSAEILSLPEKTLEEKSLQVASCNTSVRQTLFHQTVNKKHKILNAMAWFLNP